MSGRVAPAMLDRLSSWKEIAAFFQKDVRTVRRWEAERKLPVHRVPGGPRSGVYAYVAELESWLRERIDSDVAEDGTIADPASAPEITRPEHFMRSEEAAFDGVSEREVLPRDLTGSTSRPRVLLWALGAAGVLAMLVVAGLRLERRTGSQRVASNTPHQVMREKASSDPSAQELYLRGRYLWNIRTKKSLTEAQDLFSQAILHDPHFAAAFAGLADCYILLRQYGSMTDSEAFSRALVASKSAITLDNDSSEAHRSYAFVLNYWVWDFPAAEREFRRAIELNPDVALTHSWYATSLFSAGRFEDAVKEIDLARQLQPESITILANRGLLLSKLDPEAAETSLVQLERANPNVAYVHAMLAYVYVQRGEYGPYLEESASAASSDGHRERLPVVRQAQHELTAQGPHAMFAALAAGDGALAGQGYPDAMTPAYDSMRLGNRERTLHYLRFACSRREAAFLPVSHDPIFAPLADDPEFLRLLQRRNTPLNLKAALNPQPPPC